MTLRDVLEITLHEHKSNKQNSN